MEAHKTQPPQEYPDQPPPPYYPPASSAPMGQSFQSAPPPGWQPPPPGQVYIQQQPVIVQPVLTPGTRVVLVGNCPSCHAGILEDSFGICAIFLAIFFFPLGILCCLAMREKRCTNCGRSF